MKNLKAIIFLLLFAMGISLTGCTSNTGEYKDAVAILLSDDEIDVKAKDKNHGVVVASDIVYYPKGKDFTFGEGGEQDAHSKEEADKHKVVHITKCGTYILSGKMSYGQIAVDLGEDAKDDEEKKVTLVFNGADINCDIAPAVIFYNVYECGSSDEETAIKDVDTTKAGANVIIADGTVNNISGSYVAKIYKSVELNDDGTEIVDSKKLHKYDGAFYSKMSMNVFGGKKGDGILNIKAKNEGLDSELHLTINGGNINIESGNDGINTNEDNVSVTTINGGNVNIVANGSTGEGDGIDSNGWLVINGGTLNAAGCGLSMDAGIDSDMGIHINGGEVIATGNMLDRISESDATYVVFEFLQKNVAGETYLLKNKDGIVVKEWTFQNDFSTLVVASQDITEGEYTLWCKETELYTLEGERGMGKGGMFPQGEEQFEKGEIPMPPKNMETPDGNPPKEVKPNDEMPKPPLGKMPPAQNERFDINIDKAKLKTGFTVKKGENYFTVVR